MDEFKLVANEITEAAMEGKNFTTKLPRTTLGEGKNIGDVCDKDKVVSIEGSENTSLIIVNKMQYLFNLFSAMNDYYHAGEEVWTDQLNEVIVRYTASGGM